MKHTNIVLFALVAFASTTHAQQQSWTEIEDESLVVEQLGMSVDEIEGMDVYGPGGEEIAEVDDVLIGEDGSSLAVSLDVGGFLGIGDKDVAIPLESLSVSPNGLSIDLTEEELEALPEFDD